MTEAAMQKEFNYIPPSMIDLYWPKLRAWIDADPDGWAGADPLVTRQWLLSGGYQAWALHDQEGIKVVVITQMVLDPDAGPVLWIRYACGREVDAFLAVGDAAIALVARQLGCKKVAVQTRRWGWKRKLKPLGFELDSLTLARDVPDAALEIMQ